MAVQTQVSSPGEPQPCQPSWGTFSLHCQSTGKLTGHMLTEGGVHRVFSCPPPPPLGRVVSVAVFAG